MPTTSTPPACTQSSSGAVPSWASRSACCCSPRNATVTYCHSRTVDLPSIVGGADIVVAAVGHPELVKGAWIKPGSVVIDAGYNPGNIGDVEYAAVADRARLITPVPGGVGPTTIAVLLHQTVQAAQQLVTLR